MHDRNIFTFGREKAEIKPEKLAVYAVCVCLCVSSLLLYIYPSIRATSLMYEYSNEFKKLEELKEYNKKLKLEVSALSSYDFIERRAIKDLGFATPYPGQVVIIAKR